MTIFTCPSRNPKLSKKIHLAEFRSMSEGPESITSARGSARGEPPMSTRTTEGDATAQLSARGSARASPRGSARGEGPSSARGSARGSARDPVSGREAFDTARDYMSTARMHTALSALSAERNELLNKLAFIDATLEQEGRKKLSRSRGYAAPNHIGMSKK